MKQKYFLPGGILYRGLLPIILFSFPGLSFSQIIDIYPRVDTLSLWGTCTPPGFKCTLKNVNQDTDRIAIYRYQAQWICGTPFGHITAYYDSVYFRVHDSLYTNRYTLFYTNNSMYHPGRIRIPFDSIIYSYGGLCGVTLQVTRNNVIIDSSVIPFISYQTGLGVEETNNILPSHSTLVQNYPNPFNPGTVLSYSLSGSGLVHIEVFDILGRQRAILKDQVQSPGYYSFTWDASNLSSGVYFVVLTAGSTRSEIKCQLLK